MNWRDRQEVQKGDLGEAIVDDYLESKGVIPYRPQADKAHPFDRLCASSDKRTIFIAEVKTKAARTHYPDTGMNISHYNDYQNIRNKYGLDVWLFFVDEYRGEVYGNKLSELSKQRNVIHNRRLLVYPLIEKRRGVEIVYFPLEAMKPICVIDDEIRDQLVCMSNRSYAYEIGE